MQNIHTIPCKFQESDRMSRYAGGITGTVAHKMVNIASQQAEKAGAYIKHCNSSSATALNEALKGYFQKAN